MPELIEVERYRQASTALVGHRVLSIVAVDPLMVVGGDPTSLGDALRGRIVTDVRRRGKLLLVDLDDGAVVGLRFGMTGRLVVGGDDPVARLEYGARSDEPRWDRFVAVIDGVGVLRVNDPRRLGRIALDPDETALGPDAASISSRNLTKALAGGRGPLKARLLDQGRIAGLGNLLVDEILWRARLAPGRPAGAVSVEEVGPLAGTVRSTIRVLSRRGGSHTGDLQSSRGPGRSCPRCGAPLRRETVGGRTTYWCAEEQR